MDDSLERLKSSLADRYRIERELGHGGMATVYLAHDLKHRRHVALKVLRPELARALGSARFLREIEIAAQLAHPHIVPLLDSGEADGFLYYVMPFVDGESLRARLNRETQLPVDDAIAITRQVADALQYAHRSDILHRDIKPENILFEAGHAVVADFGIARAIGEAGGEALTSTGLVLGTPAYMSPEQSAGNEELDGRSDQYSLAVVLFEMLAGTPPHTGATAQAIIARRLATKAPSVRIDREAVPEAVDRALTRALERAPADRFGTVAQFADELSRSVREAAAGVEPTRERPASARRRVIVGGVAALMVLGLLAFGWLLIRSRPAAPPASGLDPAVAVLPFRTVGADLDYWREGVVDLLSFSLDGVEGLRTVDPATVMQALRRRDGGKGDPPAAPIALETARSVAASYYVTGSVIQLNDGVRLAAEAHSTTDNSSLGSVQIDGDPDSVTALVERLSVQLLRHGLVPAGTGFEQVDLSRVTTTSLPALKAYLEAERQFRQARYNDAIHGYQRALQYDSTFANAMYHLLEAVAWGGGDLALADQYEGRLKSELGRLPEREATLFRARFLDAAEGVAEAERYVRSYPDDQEGWYLLGDLLTHNGGILLRPTYAAREPFERALALNPNVGETYQHLIELAFLGLDSARALDLIEGYENHIGLGAQEGCTYRLSYDLVWGDDGSRARAMASLDTLGAQAGMYGCLQAPLAASQAALDRVARVHQWYLESTSDSFVVAVSLFRLLLVRVPRGQIKAARQVLTRVAESPAAARGSPATGRDEWPSPRQLAARFEIMLHLSGFSDTVRARRAAKVLAEVPTARASPTDLFWLGAMATEEGNRGEAEHWGNALASRAMGLRSEGETSAADYAEAYAAALSAFGDLLRAGSTSLSDFETALGKLPAADYTREQPQTYLRYRVGQVLFDRGELDAATRYFGSFHPYDFYTSPAEYYLGRIGEAKAERDVAAAHYMRFLTWWRDADPELRPVWDDARNRLTSMTQER
jgi:tetratricopeptide (TPR) repeat protein